MARNERSRAFEWLPVSRSEVLEVLRTRHHQQQRKRMGRIALIPLVHSRVNKNVKWTYTSGTNTRDDDAHERIVTSM